MKYSEFTSEDKRNYAHLRGLMLPLLNPVSKQPYNGSFSFCCGAYIVYTIAPVTAGGNRFRVQIAPEHTIPKESFQGAAGGEGQMFLIPDKELNVLIEWDDV